MINNMNTGKKDARRDSGDRDYDMSDLFDIGDGDGE